MKGRSVNTKGFTFLEIMVVVAILTILAGLIIPRFCIGIGKGEIGEDGIHNENKVILVKEQMKDLVKALHLYKIDNGRYPTTEQGLLALVVEQSRKPKPRKWRQYLEKFPYDPWDQTYLYKCPRPGHENNPGDGRVNEEIYGTFVLTNYGADGIEGSEDDITVTDNNYESE
ncbi:MAG: type II secretion system major pseudopilin GspG [Vulcanimicrobiota bacterium]